MNRQQRRMSARGRQLAAGAALAAAGLMSTYVAAVRPAAGYASTGRRVHTRSVPLIPTCADADVTVTTAAGLRSAVTASADDSVICVRGTINLTGGRIAIPETSSLTIVGEGAGATILAPADDSGIFWAYQGWSHADDTLTFANLTMQDGMAPQGGAIFVRTGPLYDVSDALVIDGVHFIDNVSPTGGFNFGGAVYANRLRGVYISDSSFSGGKADRGGAVFIKDVTGPIVIDHSTFTDNLASTSLFGIAGGAVEIEGPVSRAEIRASTFTHNHSDGQGGAVSFANVAGGTLYSTGNVFEDNHAGTGGAIYAGGLDVLTSVGDVFNGNSGSAISLSSLDDTLSLRDDSFIGNTSPRGGALDTGPINGQVVVTESYFGENSAQTYGGAIYAKGSADFTFADSTFRGNSVTGASGFTAGGAIGSYASGDVTIERTSFIDNSSSGAGGGLFLWANAVEIAYSTFSGNTAVSGGAVGVAEYTHRNPVVTVTNSTLVDNIATDARTVAGYDGGGAILGLGARLTLDFVTMIGNTADDSVGGGSGVGGGINLDTGAANDTLTITNSIISGNNADGAGADIRVSDADVSTAIDYAALTDAPSIVTDGPTSLLHVIYGPLSSLLLGPLQDNGGPTLTKLPADGSPVIDAGNPAFAPPPQHDQRGTGFEREVGSVVDLGAVESGAGPAPGPGPDPSPAPLRPPGAPTHVAAVSGDGLAAVQWSAPADSGSFPITNYSVTSYPGGRSCLTTALSCTVTGLANGTPYTFTVRALNGAGWGAVSAPSSPVTPVAPAILVSGSRGRGSQADTVFARGRTVGLVANSLVARVRFPGQVGYSTGSSPSVDDDGDFAWQRRTNRKVFVYFQSADVRSNRVTIPAR